MKTVDGYRLTRAGLDDTSPEAHRVLAEVWRRMPIARNWRKIADLFETGRELFERGERMRRPHASPLEVRQAWLKSLLPESMRDTVIPESFSPKPEDLQTLTTVARACEKMGLRYAVGGSIASSLLGQPRFTQDADLSIEPFAGRESEFAAAFSEDYYVSVPAIQDANRRRTSFNVVNTTTGFKVDLFVQKSRPFDAMLMDRRRAVPFVRVGGRVGAHRLARRLRPAEARMVSQEPRGAGQSVAGRAGGAPRAAAESGPGLHATLGA